MTGSDRQSPAGAPSSPGVSSPTTAPSPTDPSAPTSPRRPPDPSPTPPPQGDSDGDRDTELRITVRPDKGATGTTWTLRCDPPGGDHPDPEAACAAIAEAKRPFRPVPADMMCTQIYGGPQTATVKGVWRGQPVDAEYNRINGCEIARWDALERVFRSAGGS